MLAVRDHTGSPRQSPIGLREQRGPRLAETITRPRLDQRLQHLPVQRTPIDAFAHRRQGIESAAFLPGLKNGFDRDFADSFDGRQPEPDCLALSLRRLGRSVITVLFNRCRIWWS